MLLNQKHTLSALESSSDSGLLHFLLLAPDLTDKPSPLQGSNDLGVNAT